MPDNDHELFIDANLLAISELIINEQLKVDTRYFNRNRIKLYREDVKEGWNVISMKYFTPYSKVRVGMHQFIDAQDNEQYLYTQFEAFHCHRVFPSFDQPSLKAKMTLSVICPQQW